MVHLKNFYLRSPMSEEDFMNKIKRTCYDSYYPFLFFPNQKELSEVKFSDITIFCGSNFWQEYTIKCDCREDGTEKRNPIQ